MPSHLLCRFTISLCLLLFALTGFAQKQNLRIVVKDSADKKAIKGASVGILGKRDSAFLDFGIADTTGRYLFKNISRLQAGFITLSAVGYEDKKLPLPVIISQNKTRLLDTTIEVFLSPLVVALQDVVVTGTPPIRMNKDTMEFNADYFKTQPNSVLEDLLRKLPGVEVRNGNEVYVNGQRVSRFTVNGKEFFSEDPVMILKNLPTEIISKVQIANEKNTTAKETRQPDEIPKVINLKLKKEFKNGAFGKLFGGYGTRQRYEAGGLLNLFRDTLQVSFIGSSNNQNRGNNYFQEDRNAFRNIQSGGDGITTTHTAGANVSYVLKNGMQLNGQYTFTGSHSLSGNENFSKQLLGDTAQLTNSNSSQQYNSTAHRAGLRLRWKQDSTGYLTANLSTNWNTSDGQGTSGSIIYSDAVPLLSQQATARNSTNSRNYIAAIVTYDKTFEPLNLDWNINGNFSNNHSEDISNTNSRYTRLSNGLVPDSVIQRRENNTPNRQLNLSSSLNKNWGENHTASWEINYQSQKEVNGGNTFQYLETTGKTELVPSLSVQLTQYRQQLSNEISYRYNYKRFSVEAGGVWRLLYLQNKYNYDTIPQLRRTFGMLAPNFNINWRGISFSYNRNLQEPPVYAMRPVVDSSNPLRVTSGNPNLRPTRRHHFSLNYFHNFTRAGINLNLYTSADRQTDAISTSRQVFADGKTITGYLNLSGITYYNAGMGVSKNYHKKDWDYNAVLNNSMYISGQPLVLNGVLLNTVSTSISPSAELGTNYKNKYRIRGNYQISINRTRSDDAMVRTANTVQHTLSGSVFVQFTKHLTYSGNANYNITPRLTPDAKRQFLFADMSLLYTFLKKDRGQLKLTGYDIFNQNQGIYQSVYLNYITLNRSLVQRQYFMLTFIYTVRKV